MDTAISNGDFSKNSSGKIYLVKGMEETLQRCKILLLTSKDSFCYNRDLGSNLNLLKTDEPNLQGNAMLLVQEALLPVPQVTVDSVQASVQNKKINLDIVIDAYGEKGRLELSI
ncbi:MAG: hypothetical protein U0O22_09315 [Acutalibacteraceae bacterium]